MRGKQLTCIPRRKRVYDIHISRLAHGDERQAHDINMQTGASTPTSSPSTLTTSTSTPSTCTTHKKASTYAVHGDEAARERAHKWRRRACGGRRQRTQSRAKRRTVVARLQNAVDVACVSLIRQPDPWVRWQNGSRSCSVLQGVAVCCNLFLARMCMMRHRSTVMRHIKRLLLHAARLGGVGGAHTRNSR